MAGGLCVGVLPRLGLGDAAGAIAVRELPGHRGFRSIVAFRRAGARVPAVAPMLGHLREATAAHLALPAAAGPTWSAAAGAPPRARRPGPAQPASATSASRSRSSSSSMPKRTRPSASRGHCAGGRSQTSSTSLPSKSVT